MKQNNRQTDPRTTLVFMVKLHVVCKHVHECKNMFVNVCTGADKATNNSNSFSADLQMFPRPE